MGTEPLLTRSNPNAPAPQTAVLDRTAPPPGEGSRLDEAMRRADDLLIASLRGDEQARRSRRRKVWLISAMVGGLIMTLVTIAILAALAGNTAGRVENAHADSLAKEGWALWQAGQADEAKGKFEAALKLGPDNADTWNGLGWARLHSGQPKEAEEAFARAVKLQPGHPAALNGLGNIAFLQRRYGDAEKYWLKAAPSASAAWYGLAKLYLLRQQFDQAAKWAAKAAAEQPDDQGLNRILAAADAKKLDPELRRELEPPAPSDANLAQAGEAARGWRLVQQGEPAAAKEAFRAALAKNPDDVAALNGFGFALLNSGSPAEAKPLFEKCLNLDPKAYGAMNGLARCLKAEDKPEEAIKVWERMAEQAPGVTAATYGLAQTHLELRQYDKAIPYLEQLAKANPRDEETAKKLVVARGAAKK